MKITIAGEALSESELADLKTRAEGLKNHPHHPHDLFEFKSARRLKNCGSEEEYLDTFINLMRWRAGIGTGEFRIPGRHNPLGRMMTSLRRRLWRLLRYQHDRMAQQQNPINWNMLTALELLRAEQLRERRAAESRIRDLEQRIARLEGRDAG